MVKKIICCMAILLFSSAARLSAQSRSQLEDQAYAALNAKEFAKAYEAFDKLHARYPKEVDYELKLGISALNYSEKKDRAIDIFKSMRTRYKTLEIEMYLGQAYHRNYKFDDAISTLTPLLEVLAASKKKEDKEMLTLAKLIINNCNNGKSLIENKVFADISNVGAPINTREIEGGPVITTDESMMLFTYVGEKSLGGKQTATMKADKSEGMYLSDIYISYKDSAGKNWTTPVPLEQLNTKGNDAVIAISPDGQTLFTFLSNNENEGDILVSKMVGGQFTKPEPLNSNINTPDQWEGSCSISSDGKFLYFASERSGGLGGRDIWVSELVNGEWGPAVNLGPKVNTEYDEDAPFIHPDGITLFYSSKGHMSIGDYDIMFSIKEGNDWTEPKSMGVPLNTVEDDRFYVINSRGDKGFFSSDRSGSGGAGALDIYMVTPGILGEKPIVAVIKGIVYGDDKPVEAKVEVTKTAKQEAIGPYLSNSSTGKYLMALSPGYTYRLKVTAPGFDAVEEDLDIETLSGYLEQTKDFYLYTSAYIAANPEPPRKSGVVTVTTVAPPTMSMAAATATTEAAPPVAVVTTTTEAAPPAAVTTETVQEKQEVKPVEPETVTITETKEPEPIVTNNTEPEKKQAEAVTENVPVQQPKPEETAEQKTTTPETKTALAATTPKKNEKKKAQQTRAVETNTVAEVEEPSDTPAPPCNSNLPDFSKLKGKSLNEAENYKQMLAVLGDYCAENLVFKVQIGAYRKPENYKYENLKDLGNVESQQYPDGITRFTQNGFSTIRAAEKQRQKAIRKGQKDAWIVAFIGDKRYTLEDLITIEFMAKPIN